MRTASLKLQSRPDIGREARPAATPSRLATSLTLAAMSLGYGVVQLDVTIVNTALNSIGSSLGGGVAELQWVVSAYTIAFAAFILTAGALGDRIGAKRVFMAGFALFTAASAGCGLAPDAMTLIVARAVQGLGAAILVPNSLALLSHAYPDDKSRGRAVGIWAAGASLTLTAGPLVGGTLIALAGWRWIFFVNLPIGLLGLWLTWRYASETTRSPQREVDSARPDHGDRRSRLSRRRDHRGRRHRLEPSDRAGGLCRVRHLRPAVRDAGAARAAADAAADAVLQAHVFGDGDGRTTRQYRVLRADLHLQPLLPAHQWLVGVCHRACLPADAGRGAAGQPGGRAGGGADRRAADDRAWRHHRGGGLSGPARHCARHELLGGRGSARGAGRWVGPAGAAFDLDLARQCREVTLRDSGRRGPNSRARPAACSVSRCSDR